MKIICIWKIYIVSLSESNLSSNLIFTWENVQWQFCLLFWQRNGKKCKVPIQKPFQWRRMIVRMPARFENVHDCLYAIDFLWPSLLFDRITWRETKSTSSKSFSTTTDPLVCSVWKRARLLSRSMVLAFPSCLAECMAQQQTMENHFCYNRIEMSSLDLTCTESNAIY